MKKLLIILFIAILPAITVAAPQSKAENIIILSIQHSVNGGDFLPKEALSIPLKRLKSDPLTLLQMIRKSLSKHLHTLPVQINTNLELPYKLPALSIVTKVDKNSNGISDIKIPNHQFSTDKVALEWEGLSSHLTFTDNFINLKADTDFDKLIISKTDKVLILLKQTNIYSAFDSKFKPTKLTVNIPSIQAQKGESKLNLQSFMTGFDIKKLTNGLEIGNLTVQLKHINFIENKVKTGLKNLHLITDIQELDEVINFNLKTITDQVNLPMDVAAGLEDITQAINISLLNLDSASLLALQNKFHKVHNSPMAMFIMLGEFMEIAPDLLAKSPEIKLHQLLLQTSKGKLQGNLTIGLDGKKADSLAIPTLVRALHAEGMVNIDKELLNQIMINQFQDSPDNAKVAAEEQIKSYLEKKILVEKNGDSYQIIAEFKNGKLFVNEQEMPLP